MGKTKAAIGAWFVVGLVAFACSSSPEDGSQESDAGAGGEPARAGAGGATVGGTTTTAGDSNVPGGAGVAIGGKTSAGTGGDSVTAGTGGTLIIVGGGAPNEAGAASVGGDGLGGDGGAGPVGPHMCTDPGTPIVVVPTFAAVAGECAPNQVLSGTKTGKVCVHHGDYCDSAAGCDLTRSAGCGQDHRCLPPLGLGAACTNSTQCQDNLRCIASGQGKACQPVLTDHDGCSADEDCGADAYCDGYINAPDPPICVSKKQLYEACHEDNECSGHAFCFAGYGPGPSPTSNDPKCFPWPDGKEGSVCDIGTPILTKCARGFYCAFDVFNDSTCTALRHAGDSCAMYGIPGLLECDVCSFCGNDGVCHLSEPSLGVGDYCFANDVFPLSPEPKCADGLVCLDKCYAKVALGGNCTSLPCADGLHCAQDHTCQQSVPLGADCTTAVCAEGACAPDNTCRKFVPSGGQCNGSPPCEDGTYCSAQHSCSPLTSLGGACVSSEQCATDQYCDGTAKCALPAAHGQSCAATPSSGSPGKCAGGDVCSPNSHLCVTPTAPGDACVSFGTLPYSAASCWGSDCCSQGQFCDAAHVCQLLRSTLGDLGDPCFNGSCGDYYHNDLGCEPNSNTCQKVAAWHERCDGSVCDPGLDCVPAYVDGVCQ